MAPDAPGGTSAYTKEQVLQNIVRDLFVSTDVFDALKSPDYVVDQTQLTEKQAVWYEQLCQVGGLGMACQAFVWLPVMAMGFWGWLSDAMFPPAPVNERGAYLRKVIDEQGIEDIDADGEGIALPPMDDIDVMDEERARYPASPMAPPAVPATSNFINLFFRPPFARVEHLRAHVLEKLALITAAPPHPAYMEVLGKLKQRLQDDTDKEADWDKIDVYIQENYLLPDVTTASLYERLYDAVSPMDVATRLGHLIRPRYYQEIRGPASTQRLFNKLVRLHDYAPRPQHRLNWYMWASGDLVDEQDKMEKVWRQAVWYRASPNEGRGRDRFLMRRAVELVGETLGVTPDRVNIVYAPLPPEGEVVIPEVDEVEDVVAVKEEDALERAIEDFLKGVDEDDGGDVEMGM